MSQPTIISLHSNEIIQELFYHPFAANLDRCRGSCNTLNDLSNRVCVPNKTEDLNLSLFNKMTGINISKISTKHISCECKCKIDGSKCNSNPKWNNDKCRCECKNTEEHVCKKDYIWDPATCSSENGKYLGIIIDDYVITCNEIIDTVAQSYNKVIKTIPAKGTFTKTSPTKRTSTNIYILVFLLITIALLIAVSITATR